MRSSVEVSVSSVVPRVVEGRLLPSTTLPGGAVEARRSRVARAPSRSDAEGALDLGGTAPQAARHRRRHPQKRHKSPFVATNSMPTLADAFRLAHKTGVPAGLVCAPYADRWLPLLLADAQGDLVTPTPPLDGCGHIRPEVRAARTQLVFRQAG